MTKLMWVLQEMPSPLLEKSQALWEKAKKVLSLQDFWDVKVTFVFPPLTDGMTDELQI